QKKAGRELAREIGMFRPENDKPLHRPEEGKFNKLPGARAAAHIRTDWPPQPCRLPSTHAAENGQNADASMINALEQTRSEALLLGAAALVSSFAQNVEAGQDTERHGISAFGDLKYPPDFQHFDYVNPNAPKGGVFSHIGATRAFNQNFLT